MRRLLFGMLAALLAAGSLTLSLRRVETNPSPLEELRRQYARERISSVDHAKFAQLRRTFRSPQEVTEACIGCHNGRAQEVMQSSHWTWEREEYIPGRGIRSVGKKNLLNNFCIGTTGSHQSCNKCHIGYGWGDDGEFSFDNPRNVDCLACHDASNQYVKGSGMAGYPDTSVNLTEAAQHVGRPTRTTCGTCHFFGGGGNNVKHGDLESALFDAPRTVDVHMGTDGANMQCVDCHTAQRHQVKGKSYSLSSMNRHRVLCEDCHTAFPHRDETLNRHTYTVACQTCHIPTYAKVHKTKMRWDWSTAGRLQDGQPLEVKDSTGYDTYLSIKGSFTWAANVTPEYAWFNGTATHYLLGDTVQKQPLVMNPLLGSSTDPEARIIPVKVHRARQPYDPVYRWVIQPRLFATGKGEGAFWQDFDWKSAAQEGMRRVHLPFSGSVDFVETEMNWPVNHMVSPKEQALRCADCHTREQSRLAGIGGIYLPGRDYSPLVEVLGIVLVVLSFAGVAVHAVIRLISRPRTRRTLA